MMNLVQAAFGALKGKCEPVSANNNDSSAGKQKVDTCAGTVSETDTNCEPKSDQFQPAQKKAEQNSSQQEEKSWLDNFKAATVAKLLALPTDLKKAVTNSFEQIKTGIDTTIDCCKKLAAPIVNTVREAAARVPGLNQLIDSGCKLISNCASSLSSVCSYAWSGIGYVFSGIYSACKSIYEVCSSIFTSLFCRARQEEERRQEEARLEAKLEEKRFEERRLEKKREETKLAETRRIKRVEEEKRINEKKELETELRERKIEFEYTEASPYQRNIDHLEQKITAQMAAISQEISKLSSSTETSIWQSAKELNDKIAQLNSLTDELRRKQSSYAMQVADFNKSIADLAQMRHRVLYNA